MGRSEKSMGTRPLVVDVFFLSLVQEGSRPTNLMVRSPCSSECPCCLSRIVHHSKRAHFDVPQAPSSFQLFVLIMASWAGPEEEDTVTYVRKDTRPSPSIWFNLLFTFDRDQKTGL